MLNFHPLKVTAVERAAEDAACVTVEIPAALRDAYAFHAGQYVTVRRMIEGREERRTYSIVTAPGGASLKLGIRHQSHGRMSGELASRLRAGDLLDVGTPMGRFRTAVSAERRHSYVAFAAGSGITPVLSLATDILAREPHSRFTLIYGNRSISRTMFLEETLALKNRYIDRFAAHFVMSREPQQAEWLNGRIDGRKVQELARHLAEVAAADEYFVCGPGDMVDELRNAIKELNGSAPIRFERFAAAAPRAADNGAADMPAAPREGAAPSAAIPPMPQRPCGMPSRWTTTMSRAHSPYTSTTASVRAVINADSWPASCASGTRAVRCGIVESSVCFQIGFDYKGNDREG